ncbi:hypothetical protein, partial [Streptomyces sp. NPDC002394]
IWFAPEAVRGAQLALEAVRGIWFAPEAVRGAQLALEAVRGIWFAPEAVRGARLAPGAVPTVPGAGPGGQGMREGRSAPQLTGPTLPSAAPPSPRG